MFGISLLTLVLVLVLTGLVGGALGVLFVVGRESWVPESEQSRQMREDIEQLDRAG